MESQLQSTEKVRLTFAKVIKFIEAVFLTAFLSQTLNKISCINIFLAQQGPIDHS